MANTLTGRTWRLDTVGAVTTTPTYVKSIKWILAAGAGAEVARIVDPTNGAVLFEDVCAGLNFSTQELLETWWNNGFTLSVLGGGYILLEIG